MLLTAAAASGAASGLLTAGALLKARYVSTDSHSSLLACFQIGPITSFRAMKHGISFFTELQNGLPERLNERCDERLQQYKARRQPSDIVVAVPTKSGTTWLMQIAHQLRMRGADVPYETDNDVIPWMEGAISLLLEDDVHKPQPGEPRIFKSHLFWSEPDCAGSLEEEGLTKDAKLIYCFRDLKDKMYSFWKFLPPFIEREIPLWQFASFLMIFGLDKELKNLCDFWDHRHDPNVCFFFFEDLQSEHAECVRRVQSFMEIGGGEELVAQVVAKSTHEFMSRPDQFAKFDDHKIMSAFDKKRGHTRTAPLTGKVRKDGGKSGSGKEKLPAAVIAWMEWRWQCIVLPRTGFADLKAMRSAWAEERKAFSAFH